VDTKH